MTWPATQPALPRAAVKSDDGLLIRCCERSWLPDGLIPYGMRQLMRHRLRDEGVTRGEQRSQRLNCLIDELRASRSQSTRRPPMPNTTKCRPRSFMHIWERILNIRAACTRAGAKL